jgi:MFS transporter, AAHS family, benzoate transport protein
MLAGAIAVGVLTDIVGRRRLVLISIAHARATAIGTALSVGRLGGIVGPLYGGLLLSAQLPAEWPFSAFAAPAAIGAVLVTLVPATKSPKSVRPSAVAESSAA